MQTLRGVTSRIFHCVDCRKQWQDKDTAQKEARKHAERTGHKVNGEVTTAYHYN